MNLVFAQVKWHALHCEGGSSWTASSDTRPSRLTCGHSNNEGDHAGAQTQTHSLFSDVIAHPQAKFCEPALRVGVEFQDMTDDGYLKHAAFRRFADDLTSELKPPSQETKAQNGR